MYKNTLNPYVTTRFVTGDNFFSREEEVRQILISLEQEDNVIVIEGQKRIGKTSLLRQLEKNILRRSPEENSREFGLNQINTYFPIYVDLQTYASQTDKLVSFQEAILKKVKEELKISSPYSDLEQLISHVSNALEGKYLVILLDEFNLFSSLQVSLETINILNWLNEFFINTRFASFKWILSFGQKLSRLSASYDPIIRSRVPIRLSLFDEKWTEIILKSPQLFQFQSDSVLEIYSLTRGHPLLVQAFGSSLFYCIYIEQNRTTINVSDVHNVIPKTLTDYTSAISSIVRVPEVEKNLLLAVSTLIESEDRIADFDSIKEILLGQQGIEVRIEEITAAVAHLTNWEILKEENNKSLKFVVPLIQKWVYENWSFVSKQNVEEFTNFNEELAENRYKMAKKAEEKQMYEEAEINYRQAIAYFPSHVASLEGLLNLQHDNILSSISILEQLYSLKSEKSEEYRKKLQNIRKLHAKQLEENGDLIGAANEFYKLENISDFWSQEVQRLALRIFSGVLLDLQNPLFEKNKDLIQRDLNNIRELIKLSKNVNLIGDLHHLYHVRNKLIEMLSKPKPKYRSSVFSLKNYFNIVMHIVQQNLRYLFLTLAVILIIAGITLMR